MAFVTSAGQSKNLWYACAVPDACLCLPGRGSMFEVGADMQPGGLDSTQFHSSRLTHAYRRSDLVLHIAQDACMVKFKLADEMDSDSTHHGLTFEWKHTGTQI